MQQKFTQGILSGKPCTDLLNALVPGGSIASAEMAFSVYRGSYMATLTEVLGENFPAIWRVVGDEKFFELCRSYIEVNPSVSYDLSDYGDDFGQHIHNLCKDEWPFLEDLTQFELNFKYVFHCLYEAHDLSNQPLSQSSEITLANHCKLSAGDIKIYDIWLVKDKDDPDWDSIGLEPGYYLIFKTSAQNMKVVELESWQFLLGQALDNYPLGEALAVVMGDCPEMNQEEVGPFFSFLTENHLINLR